MKGLNLAWLALFFTGFLFLFPVVIPMENEIVSFWLKVALVVFASASFVLFVRNFFLPPDKENVGALPSIDRSVKGTFAGTANINTGDGDMNIGKQPFVFDDAAKEHLLNLIGNDEVTEIVNVGNPDDWVVGDQIISFLEESGYQVPKGIWGSAKVGSIGYTPSKPITFSKGELTIAAGVDAKP